MGATEDPSAISSNGIAVEEDEDEDDKVDSAMILSFESNGCPLGSVLRRLEYNYNFEMESGEDQSTISSDVVVVEETEDENNHTDSTMVPCLESNGGPLRSVHRRFECHDNLETGASQDLSGIVANVETVETTQDENNQIDRAKAT
ncbi:hypothetical protein KIN20_007578 [Parelaphostrongylus tenuis]|uniref:Uncharacterized protein n=1 Tax=Parelaphostrongylus tenuis TaxID=148309 RepID=A0AAD5MPW1_PARTN|nr:hypothetical protein KIN20_007578 [Parelaphostrongylus tenuis]